MTVLSKSVMKRMAIQRAPTQPKLPKFPQLVRETYDALSSLVCAGDTDQRALAYATMTKLCVIWSSADDVDNGRLVDEVSEALSVLFPKGTP